MTVATATQTNLFMDGVSTAIKMPNHTVWVFDGFVAARTIDGGTGAETNAMYSIKGCITRDADGTTTSLLYSGVTEDYEEATIASTWGVALSAGTDATDGGLVIRFTGGLATTIKISAVVRTLQRGG